MTLEEITNTNELQKETKYLCYFPTWQGKEWEVLIYVGNSYFQNERGHFGVSLDKCYKVCALPIL